MGSIACHHYASRRAAAILPFRKPKQVLPATFRVRRKPG
jgi:hypothetical protein